MTNERNEANETNPNTRLTRNLDRLNCSLAAAIALTLLLPLLRVVAH